MNVYKLPSLNYSYDALEPFIDEKTMRLHHLKHHKGYVDGANETLSKIKRAQQTGDFDLMKKLEEDLSFNLCGHINHSLFFNMMSPDGGRIQPGSFKNELIKEYGSLRTFKLHFSAVAKAIKGSGWVVLAQEPREGKLLIYSVENQEKGTIRGSRPLLMLDVWEHAYYLKYNNDRGAYVDAFWRVVDWSFCQRHFERADIPF